MKDLGGMGFSVIRRRRERTGRFDLGPYTAIRFAIGGGHSNCTASSQANVYHSFCFKPTIHAVEGIIRVLKLVDRTSRQTSASLVIMPLAFDEL